MVAVRTTGGRGVQPEQRHAHVERVQPESLDQAQQQLQRGVRAGRYRRMSAQHKPTGVIVTAIARELAGFCWAEMTS